MKTTRTSLRAPLAGAMILAAALLLVSTHPSHASSGPGFELSWTRVANGGTTTASGGAFTLSGTIGQHEPGTQTGGDYSLSGGFWYGGAAQQGVDVTPTTGPRHTEFALHGFVRNPAPMADLTVSYAIADGAPASLELLDVAGRRVAETSALHPGTGSVRLEPAGRISPGLYWLRLKQAGKSATAKAVLVQ